MSLCLSSDIHHALQLMSLCLSSDIYHALQLISLCLSSDIHHALQLMSLCLSSDIHHALQLITKGLRATHRMPKKAAGTKSFKYKIISLLYARVFCNRFENRFKQRSKRAKTVIQTATETIGNGDKIIKGSILESCTHTQTKLTGIETTAKWNLFQRNKRNLSFAIQNFLRNYSENDCAPDGDQTSDLWVKPARHTNQALNYREIQDSDGGAKPTYGGYWFVCILRSGYVMSNGSLHNVAGSILVDLWRSNSVPKLRKKKKKRQTN